MRTVLFLRIASVLTLVHAALHTIGGVFGGAAPGVQQATVAVMKANEFVVMGVMRSYGDFLYGAWSGGECVSYHGGCGLLAAWLAGEDGCAAAAAGVGDVPGWVFGCCGGFVAVLLCGSGGYGDIDCGLFGFGDCFRETGRGGGAAGCCLGGVLSTETPLSERFGISY